MTVIKLIQIENAVGLVVRVKNTAIEIDASNVEHPFDRNVACNSDETAETGSGSTADSEQATR
jgi:hypothetical protein